MADQYGIVSKGRREVHATLGLMEAGQQVRGMNGCLNLNCATGENRRAERQGVDNEWPLEAQVVLLRQRVQNRQHLIMLVLPRPERHLLDRRVAMGFQIKQPVGGLLTQVVPEQVEE